MSVQLILSSKQIQLDEKHLGLLNIKATFFGITQPTAVFFKVRTNLKDLIDVRPSFGVILKNVEEDGIATMNIKYLGDLDYLKKMKLQLSWVWGHFRGARLQRLLQKKINHEEFKQYYNDVKQNMCNQKSHLVLLTSKYQTKESQQSLLIDEQHKNSHESLPQDEEFQNQKQSSTKGHISQIVHTKTVQQITFSGNKQQRKGVNGILVVFLVIFSFVFGMFIGNKLEDIRVGLPDKNIVVDHFTSMFRNRDNNQIGIDPAEPDMKEQQYQATL